jgi:arsenite methyltransferase
LTTQRSHHAIIVCLLGWILSGPSTAQPAGRNSFGNPSPDVFESPKRDEWQRPEWLLDLLALKPTDTVADIGAGSGYFSRRIARRLPEGRVIAIDIDPDMLKYLEAKAGGEHISNIETRLITGADTGLSPASVDLIFICNTLHHIHARSAYYPKLIQALRPGGRIINIDFHKRDLPVGPRDLDHKLSREVVVQEFLQAGLFIRREPAGLPYQYVIEASPLPAVSNALLLDPQTVTAGKPSPEHLQQFADLGFRTVLNLQTEAEGAGAEGKQVEELGLQYVHIPIASSQITDEQIDRFSRTLTRSDHYPMLIHCRSSNRVGGLLLLHQVLHQNKDLNKSLEEARRAGLKPPLEERLLQRIAAER